jgi:hypothetical protein
LLLDTGATCHLTFQRDFFEEMNDNLEGVVYFAYRSNLKLMGIGTIRLKLSGVSDLLLHDVLYLPELRRNMLSLVHIHSKAILFTCLIDKLKYC